MERPENINPEYIAMVFRFKLAQGDCKTFPNIVRRFKMMESFRTWYIKHENELTSEEKDYLQANICPVSTDEDDVDQKKNDKDPWDE